MTIGGDFIPGDQAFDAAPDYPTLFGLQLTPAVLGVVFALLGLAGAGALVFYLVLPEWEAYQKLQADVSQSEQNLAQQQNLKQQIAKANADQEQAKQQREEVLKLFANESALDTLVLDLDKQVKARNADLAQRREQKLAVCPPVVQQNTIEFEKKIGPLATEARFKGYAPAGTQGSNTPGASNQPQVINDGAYGPAVNGKLQRKTVAIELVANYDQTTAILQSIERLQPLLVVRNLNSTATDKSRQLVEFAGFPKCVPDTEITTKFQLDALLPLTPGQAGTPQATQPGAAKK